MKENAGNEITEQEEGQETAAAPEGKTFTQEEVNQIVSSRLQREREKAENGQDAALSAREAELCAREARIAAMETLMKEGMPPELADVVKGTSEEEIAKNIDVIRNYVRDIKDKQDRQSMNRPGFRIGGPGGGDEPAGADPYRRVMGLM